MNKAQIQKLKLAIEKSRARILTKCPPLSLLLMYLNFVAVPGMDRISTNGISIFFEPSYLGKLKDDELDFMLCHQLMHILSEDIWRPEAYAFSNYHYACDLRNNSILLKERGLVPTRVCSCKIHHEVPGIKTSPSKMTVIQILKHFVFDIDSFDHTLRKKYLIDSDAYWGKDPTVFGSTVILERESSEYVDLFPSDSLNDPLSMKDSWRERAGLVLGAVSNKNIDKGSKNEKDSAAGEVTELMQRIVEKLRKPVIDWRKVLLDFISEEVCDYSFAPPDRRFLETVFFLPDFNEKDYTDREVLFMVDTSGSVDDEALSEVYSEIKGALEQYGGRLSGRLGFFDHSATVPVPMKNVDDLLSIVPRGGGGTNFHAIFSDLKNGLPACIIVFTDGEGRFPPEEIACGVPVLWIINNECVTPPWGKTLRMIPDCSSSKSSRRRKDI